MAVVQEPAGVVLLAASLLVGGTPELAAVPACPQSGPVRGVWTEEVVGAIIPNQCLASTNRWTVTYYWCRWVLPPSLRPRLRRPATPLLFHCLDSRCTRIYIHRIFTQIHIRRTSRRGKLGHANMIVYRNIHQLRGRCRSMHGLVVAWPRSWRRRSLARFSGRHDGWFRRAVFPN